MVRFTILLIRQGPKTSTNFVGGSTILLERGDISRTEGEKLHTAESITGLLYVLTQKILSFIRQSTPTLLQDAGVRCR